MANYKTMQPETAPSCAAKQRHFRICGFYVWFSARMACPLIMFYMYIWDILLNIIIILIHAHNTIFAFTSYLQIDDATQTRGPLCARSAGNLTRFADLPMLRPVKPVPILREA